MNSEFRGNLGIARLHEVLDKTRNNDTIRAEFINASEVTYYLLGYLQSCLEEQKEICLQRISLLQKMLSEAEEEFFFLSGELQQIQKESEYEFSSDQ